MTTLDELPLGILYHILSYLPTTGDLLRCEKTCRSLRAAVSNDDVWNNLPGTKGRRRGYDSRLQSFRKTACVEQNIQYIRSHQEKTTNLLLVALEGQNPVVAWSAFIQVILEHLLPDHLTTGHRYYLRGDTMGTLLELLHSNLIMLLYRAHKIAVTTCSTTTYPTLKVLHLKLLECLSCPFALNLFKGEYTDLEKRIADAFLSFELRDKVVRAAAFRAGIVILENNVCEAVWYAMVKSICLLFTPICEDLVAESSEFRAKMKDRKPQVRRRTITPPQTMRNVPPHPYQIPCPDGLGENFVWVHTPVPSQLEDVATRQLQFIFPAGKVYNFWLTDSTGSQSSSEAVANDMTTEEDLYRTETDVDSILDDDSMSWS